MGSKGICVSGWGKSLGRGRIHTGFLTDLRASKLKNCVKTANKKSVLTGVLRSELFRDELTGRRRDSSMRCFAALQLRRAPFSEEAGDDEPCIENFCFVRRWWKFGGGERLEYG